MIMNKRIELILFNAFLLTILLLVSSCSSYEVLPNLCYNDKEGTHMCGIICNEDSTICIDTENPKIQRDLEQLQEDNLEIHNLELLKLMEKMA